MLSDAAVRRALDRFIPAYHYFGSRSVASTRYGVSSFPALVIVRPDGGVEARLTDWTSETVRLTLERLGNIAEEAQPSPVEPQLGRRVLVASLGSCEFGCAHRLKSILEDPKVKKELRDRTVVKIADGRSKFNTDRHAFLGILDEKGRPVGDVLGAESSLEEARKWFERRTE